MSFRSRTQSIAGSKSFIASNKAYSKSNIKKLKAKAKKKKRKKKKRKKKLLAKSKKTNIKTKTGATPKIQEPRNAQQIAAFPGRVLPSNANELQTSNEVSSVKNQEDEEISIDSFEFWQEPIFIEQDLNAVDLLVSSHTGSDVSSSTFYNVVDEMGQDDRPLIREYGIYALTKVSSSQSFSRLVWFKLNESEPTLVELANSAVTGYGNDAQKFQHVVSSLKLQQTEHSDKLHLEAMKVMRESSARLGFKRFSASTNPIRNSQKFIPHLESAVALLENNHAQSENPEVRLEAERTIREIKQFI